MLLLFLVSFIWAFSFGLNKGQLAGVDSTAIATLRLGLSLLVFLPFFRRGSLTAAQGLRLAGVGAIQFGLMYLLYQRAYAFLPAYAVALFTLTTPLFVALLDALFERNWNARYLLAALLALAGGSVIVLNGAPTGQLVTGVVLVQLANLCFAGGQIAWRRERAKLPASAGNASLFALPYAGAVLTCILASLALTDWPAVRLSFSQWEVLAYLGIVASGLCFFWWNLGATRVNVGTLAVFNNAKVPLGVACSLIFFHESANVPRLVVSLVLMSAAVLVAERK